MNENVNPMMGVQYAKRSGAFSVATQKGAADPGNFGPLPNGTAPRDSTNGEVLSSGVDPWLFIELFLRRWPWMFLVGCLLAVAGFFAGQKLFKESYSATVKLIRLDPQNATEFYKPRVFAEQTYASLLRAPELMDRVAAKAKPPITSRALNTALLVTPMRDSDVVMAVLPGENPKAATDLANLYSLEAVRYTKELQGTDASQVNEVLKQQLAQMDADVQRVSEQLRNLPRGTLQGGLAGTLADRLQLAREELATLLSKYTDLHPLVQEQRAKIAILEKQLAETPNAGGTHSVLPRAPATGRLSQTNAPAGRAGSPTRQTGANPALATTPPAPAPGSDLQTDMLLSQLQALAVSRLNLSIRQREAQLFAENPPGYCQILAPATVGEVEAKSPQMKIIFLSVLGFVLGFGGSLMMVMLVELLDERVKTAADLKRITHLPILATLGDLKRMPPSAQSHWAFRTWTALQNRLSLSPNHGLVCGLTSSRPGEGRSTWVNLLAQAASECGFRVLTIATMQTEHKPEEEKGDEMKTSAEPGEKNGENEATAVAGGSNAITAGVLTSPAMVTQQLTGKDPQPFVHIPLPGWVWNLERRKQWQAALSQWSKIDNIVILVELPPAITPETVLLAENLPNLIWLADSRKAGAASSREQLQTLREARCHLVGAVLNREPRPPLKRRFARWLGVWVLFASLGLLFTAGESHAQSVDPAVTLTEAPAVTLTEAPAVTLPETTTNAPLTVAPVASTNRSFSITSPSQRAPWQQRLTLGPGDILNFALYGQPEMTRTEVMIGPDGKVSYLQASEVPAAGLTVDELRNKLDEELAKYYRTPRTMVTPVAFKSKKYYVLGKVNTRGVFTLEQPITLLEAVARAKGLETGLVDSQNSVDLADLQRSFLARQGKRVPVDFEKLFQEGDLSQNIPIEPDDYLFFAAVNLKEVYVFGEVNSPGPVTYTANTTVIGAIAARSGFTDKAYKGRVAVIRGSLTRPQSFVVNVWGGLEARAYNFKLEPKDIIYVAHRPFIRVEELLDLAATAFLQSMISSWATANVGPIITSPILP